MEEVNKVNLIGTKLYAFVQSFVETYKQPNLLLSGMVSSLSLSFLFSFEREKYYSIPPLILCERVGV